VRFSAFQCVSVRFSAFQCVWHCLPSSIVAKIHNISWWILFQRFLHTVTFPKMYNMMIFWPMDVELWSFKGATIFRNFFEKSKNLPKNVKKVFTCFVCCNVRPKTFHKNLTSNPSHKFGIDGSERGGHFTCIVLHHRLLPKYTIILDESFFNSFYIPWRFQKCIVWWYSDL